MKTSTKVTILLFGLSIVTMTMLIYKGYRIVPLVDFKQITTDKGTVVTGLKIEMYNPIKDKEMIEEREIRKNNQSSK